MPKSEILPHYDVLLIWGLKEMCEWLKKCEYQEAVPFFKKHNITGEKFLYLSEMQVFQMGNVSVKTKNGLKDAQKSVKGRPTVPRSTRIMNSDRPPQIPGKDYYHQTPEADDDGWGSDFSDQQEDNEELYEEPQADSGSDSEYEAPLPQHPAKMAQPPVSPNKNLTPPSRLNRPLPTPNESSVGKPRSVLGNRELPPEPPQDEYEDPSQHEEQETYENPDDFVHPPAPPVHKHIPPPPKKKESSPAARSPLRASPPPLPGAAAIPPPLPRRDNAPVPEVRRDAEEGDDSSEDYEQPSVQLFSPPKPRNSEAIVTPGKLKPPVFKNYTPNDVVKSPPKNLTPQVTGGHVKPHQPKEKRNMPAPHNNVHSVVQDSPVSKTYLTKPHSKSPAPKEAALDNLTSYTWFHGDLDRPVATEKLQRRAMNGMFLVRKSSQPNSPYALSLFYKGRVYNLSVRLRPDNKYALGTSKPDEKTFTSVPLLISYFQNNALVLGGDASTQTSLILALPK